MAGSAVSVNNIVKVFGATPVLDQVKIDVEPGAFPALLEPSGFLEINVARHAGFPLRGAFQKLGVTCLAQSAKVGLNTLQETL